MLLLNVGTKFSFCGNSNMISKSKIDIANIVLFILSHVFVPPKQLVSLIPFCGPFYSQYSYLNIVKYKRRIYMYSMCMAGYASGNFNMKKLLYIRRSSMNSWEHCRVHKQFHVLIIL
jgi:hypothetical protein